MTESSENDKFDISLNFLFVTLVTHSHGQRQIKRRQMRQPKTTTIKKTKARNFCDWGSNVYFQFFFVLTLTTTTKFQF